MTDRRSPGWSRAPGPRPRPVAIDVVMPARNEEATVGVNVAAARACLFVREVLVVDDGSTDRTAERARSEGAKVIGRESASGSKAHAMAAGVRASDAGAILFVDADCTGLTSHHLDQICEPFVDGRAAMSIGMFDYGPLLNGLLLRCPPITGERLMPRWVFEAIPPAHLDGYTVEVRINEVVAEGRLPTVARTMQGVSHRNKRKKLGRWAGFRATWWMYRDLGRLFLPGNIRWRTYWFYLRNLTVHSP